MPEEQELHFQARTLELIRKHAWDGERGRALYRTFSLRPHHSIIDVGCGTGAFTRVLARKLNGKRGGRVIGVDRDIQLLHAAEALTKNEGFEAPLISFQQGDALRLPFPDDHADRVVCQALLWLMTNDERKQAISEMMRVCKRGGMVGAVESAVGTGISYHPNRDHLSELRAAQYKAQLEGYRRLYGYDRNIGVRLPAVLQEAGLKRVRLDGIADVRLQSDDRVPIQHKLDEGSQSISMNKATLASLEGAPEDEKRVLIEEAEPVLIAGGMRWEEVYELARLYDDYAEAMLRSSHEISGDTSVHGHIMFIATGIKR